MSAAFAVIETTQNQNLWGSDRKLGRDTVKRVLAKQFCELDLSSVRFVGHGWDFEAFDISGRFIFRFPKRESVQERLAREIKALTVLKGHVPLAVPSYEWIGKPSELFPYVFGGYPKLTGVFLGRLHSVQDRLNPRLLRSVGNFLRVLHSIPAGKVLRRTKTVSNIVVETVHSSRERLRRIADVLPGQLLRRCLATLREAAASLSNGIDVCVIHGDFAPWHILVDRNEPRCVGVIDWTDIQLAEPVFDFLWLWMVMGDTAVNEVLAGYSEEVNSSFRERLTFLGLCKAISEIWYGIQSNDRTKVNLGLSVLDRC